MLVESFRVLLSEGGSRHLGAFLKKVFAADPLVCPDCHGPMRIVAFIEEQRTVRAILEHMSLGAAPQPRPPPVAAGGPVDFEYVPCED